MSLHINPEKFKEEDFSIRRTFKEEEQTVPKTLPVGEFWLQPAGLLSWCSHHQCCSGILMDQKRVLPVIYGTEDPASRRLGG